MKILFLDDNKNRWDAIDDNEKSINDIDWAQTAPEAIELLKTNDYDVVSLDHDLGGQEMIESGPGTGYEVAEWMSNNLNDKMPPMIILHTWNPCGADRMKQVLPNAVISRFSVAN